MTSKKSSTINDPANDTNNFSIRHSTKYTKMENYNSESNFTKTL